MQDRERVGRQLLDAQALVGHLVPAGSMFAFLAAHRQDLFTDEDFAGLFPSGRGRPSVPASVMAAVLVLLAGQNAGPAEGSDGTDGRWRIARKVSQDRVISVNDPEARHTRKSPEARRDGYRAHAAACPETGIITGEELTQATGPDNSDAAVAARLLAEGQPAEIYGDSAYGTGGLRAALSGAGHTAVIKPGPLRPAVEGGFTIDDFTVDEAAGQLGDVRFFDPAAAVPAARVGAGALGAALADLAALIDGELPGSCRDGGDRGPLPLAQFPADGVDDLVAGPGG